MHLIYTYKLALFSAAFNGTLTYVNYTGAFKKNDAETRGVV